MLLKVLARFVPTLLTAVMIATEISAAIRPYSIAVAPESSLKKWPKNLFTFASYWCLGDTTLIVALLSEFAQGAGRFRLNQRQHASSLPVRDLFTDQAAKAISLAWTPILLHVSDLLRSASNTCLQS